MATKTTIRQTHPNLFIGVMGFALMSVALGLNWVLATPVFLPFEMPTIVPGFVLLALGIIEGAALTILNNTAVLRITMAVAISFMFFLGLGYFLGVLNDQITSFQPAIFYTFFGLIQMSGLMEPIVNPLTMKTNGTTK